jgi:hypothetical protein
MQGNGRKEGEVDWVAAQLDGARRTRAALIDALVRGEDCNEEKSPSRPDVVVAFRNAGQGQENRPSG